MNGRLRFMVEVDCCNAAFEDSSELARILHKLADRVQLQAISDDGGNTDTTFSNDGNWPLKDANGARVGTAWLEEIE